MPSHKSTAVFGYTIEEVKAALRKQGFVRDSTKTQYKTVNGKRFKVFCGCNKAGQAISTNTPNFWKFSCFELHDGRVECPKCRCCSYIDITSLNLPER